MEKWNWPFFSRKKAMVTTHFLREDQLFAAKIWSKIIPKSGEKIQSNCSIIDHSHMHWSDWSSSDSIWIKLFRARQFCCFSHFWIFLFFHFVPKFPEITSGKLDMIESDKGEQSHWKYYCFGSHQMLAALVWLLDRRARTCRKHFWFGITPWLE